MTDLQKVREENRMLQVDSHLMTLEFDRITKGERMLIDLLTFLLGFIVF